VRRVAATLLLTGLMPLACTSAPDVAPAREPARMSPTAAATGPEPTASVVPGPGGSARAKNVRPRFAGRVSALPGRLLREMRGTTWKPGCPVPLADLRLLRFNYWDFDGEMERGPMVVHEDVATDVLWVFGRLFRARFPMMRVMLAEEFVPAEFEPRISSRRSITYAFNCRPIVTPLGPGATFSQHSYGWAIDINPVQNPYVLPDGFVRNRMARRYVDRTRQLAGMIHEGDVVVRSFSAIGWEWGGHWSGGKDYMHFSFAGG
jgi:hypothetical protein